jgi:uncharacterized caspase-like protein
MMTDARRPAISGGFGSLTRDADAMSCARILLALIASCVLLVVPAVAEKRVALVVGNSAYKEVSPLPNPVNDANDIASALKASGFDVVLGVDVDKRDFDSRIRSFTQLLETADVAVLFYAGHGLQVSGRNYLIPVDAKLQSERELDFDAVSLDFILKQMELGRADKTNIVFLDACRDNPLARSLARSMGTRSANIGKGLAQVDAGVGTFVAFSTQPGNVALDGAGRNSPFAAALTKRIKEPGQNLNAIMIEVRRDVLGATGGKQVPWDHSALTGDFYFDLAAAQPRGPQPAPAETGALNERIQKLEEEIKRSADREQNAELTQLKERSQQIEEANREDWQRIFEMRRKAAQQSDAGRKREMEQEAMSIQLAITRRAMQQKKLSEQIGELEAKMGTKASEAGDAK